MSSNLALVRAIRGCGNEATQDDEDSLETIFVLLQRLRVKKDAKNSGVTKILTLPPNTKDWYAAPKLENQQWHAVNDTDEQQLHEQVCRLYKLGIPTFLREATPPSLMRLSIPLDAFVSDSFVSAETARTAWDSLHEGLSRLVISAMAEVAVKLFGEKASSQLVAVFRASGYGIADSRWKVSLRINFVEIVVTLDTARRVRDLLVERLAEVWQRQPREGWAQALEAGSTAQDPSLSFWEQVVDERAFREEAHHRLVWCDVTKGEEQPPMPQERPLVPHALVAVIAEPGGQVEQRPVAFQAMMRDHDWVRLGSPYACDMVATEFWSEQSMRQPPPAAVPAAASAPAAAAAAHPAPAAGACPAPVAAMPAASARGPAQAHGPPGAEEMANGWIKYMTSDGKPYFHRPATNQTVWQPPVEALWKQVASPEGQVYYYNVVTLQSSWTLPAVAENADGAHGR